MKAVLTIGTMLVSLSAAVLADSGVMPDGIRVDQTGAGTYIMTQSRQSLYWNESEAESGEVTCLEECLEAWTPFHAPENTQVEGQWTVIKRSDDVSQWAYQGKPLYLYVKDTFPGARLGHGLSREQWQVLFEPRQVPPGMKIESTPLGLVLADHSGRTLYSRAPLSGANGQQAAFDHWTAFEAPWLALDQGEWTIQPIADGVRQWFYEGRPLYTYEKDNDPQDIHGHGLNGQWSAVILEPAPGLPPWITVQQIDLGLAYANEDGLTIYAPVDINAIKAAQTCPEECMKENWRPILAGPQEESIGNWVIVENDGGQMQWSYKGQLLYTHTRDTKPGEMKGNGIAVGYRIGDGWRIIPVDSGLRRSRT